jgi:hypothetical protein
MVLDLSTIIKEEVRDAKGNLISEASLNSLPPTIDLSSRKARMGVAAAQEVLSAGGSMNEALDAAVKARNALKQQREAEEEQELPSNPANPELEELIRYVHAIAKLHSGRFEDLTPRGMLEVAMLCPYPVCSFDDWKVKINAATKGE